VSKTTVDVAEALAELEAAGRILLYEVDGARYLALLDWDTHQPRERIRKRKDERRAIPPPDGAEREPAPAEPEGDELAALFADGATTAQEKPGEAKKKPATRQPDALWDALVEAMGGSQPVTSSARGAWNKALKELRDAEVTPDVLLAAAAGYRRKWPTIDLTPPALAKHLHLFMDASKGEDVEKAARAWFDTMAAAFPPAAFADELATWVRRGLSVDVARELSELYEGEVRDAA
jgi:hypothetical protein